ncbi:MAG: adenylate/guanylate cyclase domain-containing protein [Pseudomonadota bacterium]
MIFSLQRRFLLLLLLPVTALLLGSVYWLFIFARSHLEDEWKQRALLRLEKTAHEIQMKLDVKRELIELIAAADPVPQGKLTQAFLILQLLKQKGVVSVDLDPIPHDPVPTGPQEQSGNQVPPPESQEPQPSLRRHGHDPHGHQGMDRPEHGARHPVVRPMWIHPEEKVKHLVITWDFGAADSPEWKRITVRVGFDSILHKIIEIAQWEKGSTVCLVAKDGTYLAHTDRAMANKQKLGAGGDELENEMLKLMQVGRNLGVVQGNGDSSQTVLGFCRIPQTDWFLILSSPGREILEPLHRLWKHFLLAGLACLVVAGLLIRANTAPVGRAIAEISEAARHVEQGDYSCMVTEDRSDELGELKRRFNLMVAGLRERDLIEQTFGRYIDKGVARELMTRPGALALGGENRVVTILMSDLRDFTTLSEKLDPPEVISLLNRHFSLLISVVTRYNGIIVDFYGDSMLVFFDGISGDPAPRAWDAAKCAVDMQREAGRCMHENEEMGLPPLRMGIGIHTGEVVVGNIGSETRAKYGIVGSAVNETDRIVSAAKGGEILLSLSTQELLGERARIGAGREVCLKGLEGSRSLFELLGMDGKSHLSDLEDS